MRLKKYKGMLLGLTLCAISLLCMQALFGAVCPLRLLTGFPCPGCGLTRAGILFLQGRFAESLQMNLFFILGLFFGTIGIFIKKVLKKNSIFINTYVIIVLALFILYYIYRMYRYFPETEPLTYWRGSLLAKLLQIFGR